MWCALLAPLTIPDAVLEEGLGILSAAVKDARRVRVDARGRLAQAELPRRRRSKAARYPIYRRSVAVMPKVRGRNVKSFSCGVGGPAGLNASTCACA